MTQISVRSLAISILSVLGVLVVLILLPITPYPEMAGTQKITTATLCGLDGPGCGTLSEGRPVALPYFPPPARQTDVTTARFRLSFENQSDGPGTTAVFMPKFSDALDLQINGVPITPDRAGRPSLFHHWHRPFFAPLPQSALLPGVNQFDITLRAYGFSNLALFPVYVGDAARLDFAFQVRQIMRVGIVRINFALILFTSAALFLFWLTRRNDVMYIWLAGAYLCASLFCFHWVMPNILENYSLWTRIWNLSIPVFIWSLLSFLMIWFDLPIKTLRKTLGLALIPITLAVLLAPSTYLILVLGISQFTSLVLGLICLSLIVESRSKQSKLNFYMVFGLLSLALTFAISEWIYNRLHPEWFLVQFGHLIPLALFLLLLWIIMSQLSNSLQKFEALTETQQSEIQAKTQELEQSYQQLSERSKQLAIDEERHRIMLELHDGVGGQLVNALAYMSNAGNNDPVLKSALEDSLRDMGLMIDSLDITDDVSTLLGMLRGRIEPLLNNHQMTLRWQIDEDPLLGAPSPSTNLNLLRIVQEAITNSVKHSGASTVTVTAMRNSVSVLDDGCGFDPTTQRAHPDQHKGMGLRSMKKRAADMNLDLNITASPSGTRVVLSWD